MKYVLVMIYDSRCILCPVVCPGMLMYVYGRHNPDYVANRVTVGLGQWEARGDTDCHICFLLPFCCGPHPWLWLPFSRDAVPRESPGPYRTLLTLLRFIPSGLSTFAGFWYLHPWFVLSALPTTQHVAPLSESPLGSG